MPLRFKDDARPRIAFLIAEDEYKTERTLPEFAAKHLSRDFRVSFVFDRDGDNNSLTGLGALSDADVLVVSVRRRVFPEDQLAVVRRFVSSGRGVVGIRTASHAFSPKAGDSIPAGRAAWPDFDPEVLGGHYQNHHKAGPKVTITSIAEASAHPVLKGVDVANLASIGTLYKVSPLARSTTPLLSGTIPGQPTEPIAWTNLTAQGGRVVYTSLGHQDDFTNSSFVHLLRNAITWTAGREVAASLEVAQTTPIPFPK